MAKIYLLFAVLMLLGTLDFMVQRKLWFSPDLIYPLLMVIAMMGLLQRRRWGQWLAGLISLALMIYGFELGLLLGGLMIWQLIIHNDSFE
ncbi:hypothetical protein [Marinicella meishanensis]|uniref:hypothetical protein n=1 Tax=Marinicella meishanensis TaxID=2873263 RepID=UPI001CBD51CE|nr:hypothetical protein [Marinicella sp. NBU2979]